MIVWEPMYKNLKPRTMLCAIYRNILNVQNYFAIEMYQTQIAIALSIYAMKFCSDYEKTASLLIFLLNVLSDRYFGL